MDAKGKPLLYGLVLAGGRSTRMKKDKALLEYYGKNQTEHCFDLLTQFCAKVFLSNRMDQSKLSVHKNFPQIHDTFSSIGPLDGIISAMAQYPHVAWLVLACDLPFVTENVLSTLVKERNPLKVATAYRSSHDDLPEPLCAVYEPSSFPVLLASLTSSCICPRKILINSDVHLIAQAQKIWLENINSPEEYQSACQALQHQKKDREKS